MYMFFNVFKRMYLPCTETNNYILIYSSYPC